LGGRVPVHLCELLSARDSTREENRRKLLQTIMAKPGSQAYLSKRSGLSQATVSAAVVELSDRKMVRTSRDGKQILVEMAPTTGAAVGIELGFQASAVVARRVEQRHDEARTAIHRDVGATLGSTRWPRQIADAIRDVVDELGEEEIAAVGLAVPRVVDPRSGQLVPPFLQPWKEGDDPGQMLESELRQQGLGPRFLAPRVVLDNDANLAALAESIYAFDDVEILIGIKASTGIGAGIVVGGRLFRGGRGVAGEIGHVVVQPSGRFCSCGGRGCLETIIGADALVEQAKTVLGRRKMESPDSLDQLVQMAGSGNLVCQRVLQEAATTLGFAIGNLCNVLNPQVVVLGGAFGRSGAVGHTLRYCQEAIQRSAMRAAGETGLKVSASQVQHAAAHGALVVALEGTSYPA
jgi:predicted NBD/HSP70 family sugar kinase